MMRTLLCASTLLSAQIGLASQDGKVLPSAFLEVTQSGTLGLGVPLQPEAAVAVVSNAAGTSTHPAILTAIFIMPVVVIALGLMKYAASTTGTPDSQSKHVLKKLSKERSEDEKEGWRHSLGEMMESACVSGTVIALIFIDIFCTVVNDMLENTDLLNPKYEEQGEKWANTTHTICVSILIIFLLEQLLHIVAFGVQFFSHWWYVMDLVIVYISLVCETVLEGTAEDWITLLIILRLWKVLAFLFDVCLAKTEYDEQK